MIKVLYEGYFFREWGNRICNLVTMWPCILPLVLFVCLSVSVLMSNCFSQCIFHFILNLSKEGHDALVYLNMYSSESFLITLNLISFFVSFCLYSLFCSHLFCHQGKGKWHAAAGEEQSSTGRRLWRRQGSCSAWSACRSRVNLLWTENWSLKIYFQYSEIKNELSYTFAWSSRRTRGLKLWLVGLRWMTRNLLQSVHQKRRDPLSV